MSRPAGEHPYDPYRQPTYLPPVPPPMPPPGAPPAKRGPRRLWYAIALVVLLPAWLGFMVWRSGDQPYGKDVYDVATVVEHGQTADVSGTTWRLGSIGAAPPPPAGSQTAPPPRGSTLVRAYVEVTPRSAAAAKAITGCTFAAQDAEGRVWDTADSSYVEDDEDLPDDCTPPGFGALQIPVGHTQQVGVTYLVPTAAARSLRPMVRPQLGTRYVLFH